MCLAIKESIAMPPFFASSQPRPFVRVVALLLLLTGSVPFTAIDRRPVVAARADTAASLNLSKRVAVLPVVGLALATPTPPPAPQPTLDVVLRASPYSQVERDSTLRYELRVRNSGRGNARGLAVRFSFDARLILQDARLDRSRGDWVSGVEATNRVTSRVVVTFGAVRAGEARSGTLILRVDGRRIANGDSLGARATFPCSDNQAEECRSNTLLHEVGRQNSPPVQNDQIRLTVAPDRGPPGTLHRFSSERYLPGERVVTWLNTPGGVRALDLTATADRLGRIAFELPSSGFAVGDYGFVAYGIISDITGVGPFRVQGPGGLLAAARATRQAEPDGEPPVLVGGGGIGGKLTNSAGVPLGGVVVLVRDANDTLVAAAVSLPSGVFFVASGLPSGSYRVEVAPSLSLDPALSGFVDVALPAVDVVEPSLTRLPPLLLQPGGAVSGVVTAQDDSEPLADVAVLVATTGLSATVVAATTTDERGAYTTPPLDAGAYQVEFVPQRALDAEAQGYATAQRAAVSVAAGATTALNVQLAREAANGQISGRVIAADTGVGLAGALVAVSDQAGQLRDVALSDQAGEYTTIPLLSGVYSVEVLTRFSDVATTTLYLGRPTTPLSTTVQPGTEARGVDARLTRDP
jgi:hypothetical protein